MPNNVVKSYAEKSGKTVAEVEALWKEVEAGCEGKFDKKDDSYYSYVNSIVKKRLSLKECKLTFKDFRTLKGINDGE